MLADDEAPGEDATEGTEGAGVVTVNEASHDEDRLIENDVEGGSAIASGTPHAALDEVVSNEGTTEPTDVCEKQCKNDEEEILQNESSVTTPSESLDVDKDKGDLVHDYRDKAKAVVGGKAFVGQKHQACLVSLQNSRWEMQCT
jgi:hypothetical protein